MAFLPRLSYLNLYGDELHQTGGDLLKARLSEWERELQYLRFRIAEWKQFGSVEHPDYYPFRSFLLQKIRNHIYFELKVRCSLTIGRTTNPIHSLTDVFNDIDGMRRGGAKRRRASAAELRGQDLRLP